MIRINVSQYNYNGYGLDTLDDNTFVIELSRSFYLFQNDTKQPHTNS